LKKRLCSRWCQTAAQERIPGLNQLDDWLRFRSGQAAQSLDLQSFTSSQTTTGRASAATDLNSTFLIRKPVT